MNIQEGIELERELKKDVKARKVSVIQLEDGTYRYAFRFYSWTERGFKTYITKRGHHWNANEDGKETRMWEAWNDAGTTGKMHLPIILLDQDIVLICPIELNAIQANKFSSEVDEEVLRLAAPYNVRYLLKGMKGAKNLGTEAYDIADSVWQELVQKAYNTICEKYKVTPEENQKTKWEAQGEIQTSALNEIDSFIQDPTKTKGMLDIPPGTGKTPIFMLALQNGLENGTIPQRGISILATPYQPLCNKNLTECQEITIVNGLEVEHIEYHSGSHNNNKRSFLTSDQEKTREKLYADEINYHLKRGKHVVIHVCFASYIRLQNALDLVDIEKIQGAWIDEFQLQCSNIPTANNSMIRHIVENQVIPIKKQIAMTGTIVEHDLNSTYEPGTANYSASNPLYWGSYIKRVTYGETVLQGLNLPFNVVGINRLESNITRNVYGSVKINELTSSVGFNLTNSIIANTILCRNGHNVVLSIFAKNDEALTVAEKLKEAQKANEHLKGYKIVCLTTAIESNPSRRTEELKRISKDKENKYIILTGPWVITGSNCPRIDSILWNFCPQSYVNIVQGSLRAARMLRNSDHTIDHSKDKFTVYFILTNDVIKNNTFASALEKLHKTLYAGDTQLFISLTEEEEEGFFTIDNGDDLGAEIEEETETEEVEEETETEEVEEETEGLEIEEIDNIEEELEEIKAILEARLEDLMMLANTEDFSSGWSYNDALNNISRPRLMKNRADQWTFKTINFIENLKNRDNITQHIGTHLKSIEDYVKSYYKTYDYIFDSLDEARFYLGEENIEKIQKTLKKEAFNFFMS